MTDISPAEQGDEVGGWDLSKPHNSLSIYYDALCSFIVFLPRWIKLNPTPLALIT